LRLGQMRPQQGCALCVDQPLHRLLLSQDILSNEPVISRKRAPRHLKGVKATSPTEKWERAQKGFIGVGWPRLHSCARTSGVGIAGTEARATAVQESKDESVFKRTMRLAARLSNMLS
jgi:hypothetical protein